MNKLLKTKKDIYFIILLLVVVISFMQIHILASELYHVVDSSIKASAQDDMLKQLPKEQPVIRPEVDAVVPTEITVEKIELNLPVISSPLINGTWNTYTDVANYAEGTAGLNDKNGNIGIFAHDRIKGFSKIKQLQVGDTIVLKGGNTIASYTVEKSAIANPSDVDVFYPTSEPKLTLVTCDGAFSEKRYIVVAALTNIQKN